MYRTSISYTSYIYVSQQRFFPAPTWGRGRASHWIQNRLLYQLKCADLALNICASNASCTSCTPRAIIDVLKVVVVCIQTCSTGGPSLVTLSAVKLWIIMVTMRCITILTQIHAGCTQVVQRRRVALKFAAWKGAIFQVHIEPSSSIA
jgi:hypothetical protein